jgi:hypothetical protein
MSGCEVRYSAAAALTNGSNAVEPEITIEPGARAVVFTGAVF